MSAADETTRMTEVERLLAKIQRLRKGERGVTLALIEALADGDDEALERVQAAADAGRPLRP